MDDEDLGICNRCLVIVNSASVVRARFANRMEFCEHPTVPVMLKKWVEARLYLDGCQRFEVDNTTDRFRAISTWYGDPVCSWHLWMLADAEAKAFARQGTGVR